MKDLNGKTNVEEDSVNDSSYDHSPINTQVYTKPKDLPCLRKNLDPHPTNKEKEFWNYAKIWLLESLIH